jgi:hypothetical protein
MSSETLPPLYRGVLSPIDELGQHEFIREDRRPRDSGRDVPFNISFNLMVERRFGFPLIRRRALFVCGDVRKVTRYARELGPAYIGVVKPLEPFRFLYSPLVKDSFQRCARTTDLARRYMACFRGHQAQVCTPLLKDISMTLAGFDAFFSDNPNIDKGIFTFGGLTLKQRLLRVLDADLGYRTDDLATAARSGAEVMFFDCPSGYRLDRIRVEQVPSLPSSRKALSTRAL